jgi:Ca2+-binding RTX toxin-like protein
MRRAGAPFALALAALALLPAGAAASTARTEITVLQGKGCSVSPESCVIVRMVYEAGPGEANDVQLSRAGSSVVVRDTGANLQAGSGCQQQGPNQARCSPPEGPSTGIILVRGALGDAGDKLQNGSDVPTDFDGGAGDDHLIGGIGFDVLGGGPGRDRLEGAGGFDTLHDGAGGTGREPDVMDGGDGPDTVRYTRRRERVFVNLLQPEGTSGAEGEGDTLLGIEVAHGGAGPDVMRAGFDNPVEFFGRGGDDRLTGSYGADQLYGDSGNDKINAIFGNDRVEGGKGNDRLQGGCDRDKVYGDDGRDRIFDADGSRDRLRGGRDRDFAEHDQLDDLAQIETSQGAHVDACAL